MIRYLAGPEKKKACPLWEQAFPEDVPEFLDYYNRNVLPGNRVLVYEEAGAVRGMIHRNPYQIQAGSRIWNSEYIVGVATDAAFRRQGIMASLLTRCLADAGSEQMPLVFLMPVSETIYRPFGFATVYAQPQWEMTEADYRRFLASLPGIQWEPLAPSSAAEAAACANGVLARRYDCFVRQNPAHLVQLQEELALDHGCTVIGRSVSNRRIQLMFSQIREGRHILLADLICVPEPSSSMPLTEKLLASFRRKDSPLIMIRPADIKVFLEMFQSESDGAFTLALQVTDPAFPAFAQTWKWQFHDGISCAAPAGEETAPVRLSIPALTRWLFGAESLSRLIRSGEISASPQQTELMEQVAVFHGFRANDTV